ncbi:hypothetical protein HDV00_007586 [Rhizophlyctis rosea]|nr:hypothetical protein HDV00_007586 [Rhizophlyctis rosea]
MWALSCPCDVRQYFTHQQGCNECGGLPSTSDRTLPCRTANRLEAAESLRARKEPTEACWNWLGTEILVLQDGIRRHDKCAVHTEFVEPLQFPQDILALSVHGLVELKARIGSDIKNAGTEDLRAALEEELSFVENSTENVALGKAGAKLAVRG